MLHRIAYPRRRFAVGHELQGLGLLYLSVTAAIEATTVDGIENDVDICEIGMALGSTESGNV